MKELEFSIDRIAGTFTFPEMPDDFIFDDIAIPISEIFIRNAGKIELDISNLASGMNIKIKGQFESEPLIYWNKVPYVKAIRFDYNPKRFRELDWARLALKEIVEKIKNKQLINNPDFNWVQSEAKVTQTDLAIDMYDWAPDSYLLKLVKLGSSQTMIFDDRSGDVSTRYYGARGSSSYARWYVKSAERKADIVNRYRSKKSKIMNQLDKLKETVDKSKPHILNGFDLTDKNDLESFMGFFIDLNNPAPLGLDMYDCVDLESVKEYIDLDLNQQKALEIADVPDDWVRLEIVLRVQALKKDRGFYGANQFEFDPDSVREYLEKLNVGSSYLTISDPVTRSLVDSIERGVIDKKDLSGVYKKRVNAVLKWADVSAYYSLDSSNLKYKPTADLIPSDRVKERITRNQDDELINLIKQGFEDNKDRLLSELSGYFK